MSAVAEPSSQPDRIPFSEFRADCSRILDRVEETGDTVTVTKNGRPVAVVTPCPKQSEGFWDRYGKLIKVEPGADIDRMGEEEWGADWCPTHEIDT